ncbi:MAG: type II secretion system F family protein [Syntrophorhabdaceae bacterium]|nr:type II secretion system F family protein [Syntrophorhabdaceae bacterium]MDD4196240.1 type II secretion system F family protein [Syntrophorhabdaceae bacterium]
MAVYSYTATTYEGSVVEGVVEAPDERTAVEKIRNTGIIPIKISVPKTGVRRKLSLRSSRSDLLTFTTELSALLGAGLPIDRSLNILSEISEGARMKEVINSVLSGIRGGSSFSEALQRHPDIFPKLYTSMVRAGETGGVLDVVLDKLNEFLETSKELRDSVVSAMVYPLILTVTGGISIVILLTFVIPRFTAIFSEIGGSLPLSTRFILGVSTTLRSLWWVLLPAIAGVFVFVRFYVKTERGAYKWDELKLKLFGDVVTKLETARFCRTLGTLLKSGVPFLQALNNSKDVMGNRIMAGSVDSITRNVREGKGIAAPLMDASIFPQLALSMIKVGEETGQLDTMLLRVATTYEKGLRDSVKRFMSLLEPAIILAMGIIIAFIVISMLMAVFSILELPF